MVIVFERVTVRSRVRDEDGLRELDVSCDGDRNLTRLLDNFFDLDFARYFNFDRNLNFDGHLHPSGILDFCGQLGDDLLFDFTRHLNLYRYIESLVSRHLYGH